MKKHIFVFLSFLGLALPTALSQPLYGFQSIGKHTWFFGLKWDGKASVSLGYVYRAGGGTSFRDFSAEWQFPFEDAFQIKDSRFIGGIYAPINQKSRPFFALGVHGRIDRFGVGDIQKTQYQLAITGMPSYTFAGVLSEKPYLTAGTRLTYLAVLYEQSVGQAGTNSSTLPYHGVELGGHLDMILERTLGIAVNGYFGRWWKLKSEQIDEESQKWKGNGDLYFGPTYNLRRW